jgi:hypothetical protein
MTRPLRRCAFILDSNYLPLENATTVKIAVARGEIWVRKVGVEI